MTTDINVESDDENLRIVHNTVIVFAQGSFGAISPGGPVVKPPETGNPNETLMNDYDSLTLAIQAFTRLKLDQIVRVNGNKVYPNVGSSQYPGFGPGIDYDYTGQGVGITLRKPPVVVIPNPETPSTIDGGHEPYYQNKEYTLFWGLNTQIPVNNFSAFNSAVFYTVVPESWTPGPGQSSLRNFRLVEQPGKTTADRNLIVYSREGKIIHEQEDVSPYVTFGFGQGMVDVASLAGQGIRIEVVNLKLPLDQWANALANWY